jgi:hypothetical protein
VADCEDDEFLNWLPKFFTASCQENCFGTKKCFKVHYELLLQYVRLLGQLETV